MPAFCCAVRSCGSKLVLRNVPFLPQDAVTVLLARTTAQLQAVERELAEEQAKLESTEEGVLEMARKEEQAEAASERLESLERDCPGQGSFTKAGEMKHLFLERRWPVCQSALALSEIFGCKLHFSSTLLWNVLGDSSVPLPRS